MAKQIGITKTIQQNHSIMCVKLCKGMSNSPFSPLLKILSPTTGPLLSPLLSPILVFIIFVL